MLQSWMRFRSLLVAGFAHPTGVESTPPRPAEGPPRRPPVRTANGSGHPDSTNAEQRSGFWRLLASNNREVARSFLLYDGFRRAQAHVQQMQAHADALSIVIVRVQRNGSRGWVITHDDAPVIMCSRWYDSISTGVAAAEGALAALPTARLATAPDRSSASGRFQRRTVISTDASPW